MSYCNQFLLNIYLIKYIFVTHNIKMDISMKNQIILLFYNKISYNYMKLYTILWSYIRYYHTYIINFYVLNIGVYNVTNFYINISS